MSTSNLLRRTSSAPLPEARHAICSSVRRRDGRRVAAGAVTNQTPAPRRGRPDRVTLYAEAQLIEQVASSRSRRHPDGQG